MKDIETKLSALNAYCPFSFAAYVWHRAKGAKHILSPVPRLQHIELQIASGGRAAVAAAAMSYLPGRHSTGGDVGKRKSV